MIRFEKKLGATLVELLAGISLLLILMGSAYWAINYAPRIASRQQQSIMAGRRAWRTLQEISSEIRAIPAACARPHIEGSVSAVSMDSAFEYPLSDYIEALPFEEMPADMIRFKTLRAYAAHGQKKTVAEYGLRTDSDGRTEGIYRRFSPTWQGIEDTHRDLYNPQAMGFKVLYLGEDGDEWQRGWSGEALPKAVKIKIWMLMTVTGEKPEIEMFQTVVALPAAKEIEL